MPDIATVWDANNNRGDWRVANGDLAPGNDLYTAVLISLFTDVRAQPGDVIPDGSNDPRGWWGDIQPDGSFDSNGSRLWLLSREKQTQQVLNRAVSYAKEALKWLLTDGVAARVDVTAEWNAPSFLALAVAVSRGDGKTLTFNYNWAWNRI